MRVEDSFLFAHTGDVFHDWVLRSASWIAVALLIAAVTAIVLSQRNGRGNRLRAPLIATVVMICGLLFPFSDVIWRHVPELRFLQFPWRWLLVLGLAMAALVGLALRGSFLEAKTRRMILVRAVS